MARKSKSGIFTTKVAKPVKLDASPPPAPAVQFAFPTKSRCPRCRGDRTRCNRTAGQVQYRECLGAVCRHKYKAVGYKI